MGFFWLYHDVLQIGFTFLSALYSLAFTISLYVLICLSEHIVMRVATSFIGFIFYVYVLSNFVHYQVYKSFLTLDIVTRASIGRGIDFLLPFYRDVPVPIYFELCLLLFTTLFLLWRGEKQGVSKKYFLVGCIGMQIMLLAITFWYREHPKPTWWDVAAYRADMGVVGHMYTRISLSLLNSDPGFSQYSKSDVKDRIRILRSELAQQNSKENKGAAFSTYEKTPHIIFYQLESVPAWAVQQNPSAMPFLADLQRTYLSADRFIPNSCHTINAEYSTLCGGLAHTSEPISSIGIDGNFYCLPELLREKFSYRSALYHANESRFWNRNMLGPKWGFDEMHFYPEYDYLEPDAYILEDIVESIKTSDRPTLSYLIGYTSHAPHNPETVELQEEKFDYKIESYEDELDQDILDNIEMDAFGMRIYLGYLKAVDDGIATLFTNLEENSLLENTIVVIFGDHRYFAFNTDTRENFYRYNEVPFVLYSSRLHEPHSVSIGSHVDIPSTILDLIPALELEENGFLGSSMLNSEHKSISAIRCLNMADLVTTNSIVRGNTHSNQYEVMYGESGLNLSDLREFVDLVNFHQEISDSNRH